MALGDATIAVPNSSTAGQLPQDIGSLLALFGGLTGSSDLSKIAQSADPWGPQRGQYQTQLNQFMANPASIFTDPAFQAAQRVGAENISRQAGAAGMASSGNRLADLFSFGQSSALDFEKQRYNELANLAGVNAGSPVAAAGLQTRALQTQGTNLASGLSGVIPLIASLLGLNTSGGLGGLLGSAGSAIGSLFGGGGGDINWNDILGGLDTSGGFTGGFTDVVPGFGGGLDIGGGVTIPGLTDIGNTGGGIPDVGSIIGDLIGGGG